SYCVSLYTSLTCFYFSFFFFNLTATPEIYTLSLHDALPILDAVLKMERRARAAAHGRDGVVIDEERGGSPVTGRLGAAVEQRMRDRKSTRLNSSHLVISYAVFCLKKKKKKQNNYNIDLTKYN